MREYNNRDRRMNDNELDPCIAAEVRMKKALFSPRLKRQLLVLFAIIFLIIIIVIALFFIINGRSTEKTDKLMGKTRNNTNTNNNNNTATEIKNNFAIPTTMQIHSQPFLQTTQRTSLEVDFNKFYTLNSAMQFNDSKSLIEDIKTSIETEILSTQSSIFSNIVSTSSYSPSVVSLSFEDNNSLPGTSTIQQSNTVAAFLLPISVISSTSTNPSAFPNVEKALNQHSVMSNYISPISRFNKDVNFTAKDCKEQLDNGNKNSGFYRILVPKMEPFDVFCDMTTSGGGWTLIQRRESGEVYFSNRTWIEYEEGFGEIASSFWLGLKKIRGLVAVRKSLTLRIELKGDFCNDVKRCSNLSNGFWWGEWNFKIADSIQNYKLTISPAKAGNLTEYTTGDKFFIMNNGRAFTTIDRDNDKFVGNCAQFRDFGGWWHNDCSYVALNGRYGDSSWKMRGLYWFYSIGQRPVVSYHIKPKRTVMKIRPNE